MLSSQLLSQGENPNHHTHRLHLHRLLFLHHNVLPHPRHRHHLLTRLRMMNLREMNREKVG
jgi:hypothetical protein